MSLTPESSNDDPRVILTSEQKLEIQQYLMAHWQTPETYVVHAFAHADVVLLAETHGIKHNLELVHRLIPQLYAAGVYNIGMEFGAVEDQAALDALVMGDQYAPDVARQIMFNYNVGWAYVEYMEVYRIAWELNRRLPAQAPRFRVVNLSYRYDWRAFHGPRTPYSMQQVFPKGDTERFRAGVVQQEILAKQQKILILTGSLHAFTKYRYPEFDYYSPGFVRLRDVTLGNYLEQMEPGRNWTILLHAPWDARDMTHSIRPLGGVIDDVMASFEDSRVGFDTASSPFAMIEDQSSYYAIGYEPFTLATIADGYIYERPFHMYEGCTVDEQFLTDENWPQAREQIPDPDWNGRPETRDQYLQQIRAFTDMRHRLKDVL